MHRVDTPGNIGGLWQDGDPSIGQVGTTASKDWFNDVQENINNVIESTGEDLVKGQYDQLNLAIRFLISQAVAAAVAATRTPVGTVISLDGPDLPSGGYVRLDTQYLRADYPDLVAFYQSQGRLITGTTGAHFRTPDYEGLFGRAASSDNTVDPDGPRGPGSLQADAYAAHDHSIPARDNANSGTGYVEDADASASARNTNTGMSGGAETRPKNVAFTWFIKA
jgi:hypothetical protein